MKRSSMSTCTTVTNFLKQSGFLARPVMYSVFSLYGIYLFLYFDA